LTTDPTWPHAGGSWRSRLLSSKGVKLTSAAKNNFQQKHSDHRSILFIPRERNTGISLDPKNPLFSLLDSGSGGDDGGRRRPSMTTVASLSLVPHLLIKPSFRCLSRKVSTGFSPVFFSSVFRRWANSVVLVGNWD
jgi:hypothetical protein